MMSQNDTNRRDMTTPLEQLDDPKLSEDAKDEKEASSKAKVESSSKKESTAKKTAKDDTPQGKQSAAKGDDVQADDAEASKGMIPQTRESILKEAQEKREKLESDLAESESKRDEAFQKLGQHVAAEAQKDKDLAKRFGAVLDTAVAADEACERLRHNLDSLESKTKAKLDGADEARVAEERRKKIAETAAAKEKAAQDAKAKAAELALEATEARMAKDAADRNAQMAANAASKTQLISILPQNQQAASVADAVVSVADEAAPVADEAAPAANEAVPAGADEAVSATSPAAPTMDAPAPAVDVDAPAPGFDADKTDVMPIIGEGQLGHTQAVVVPEAVLEPTDQTGGRTCPNCGAPVDDDDKFCTGCGSLLPEDVVIAPSSVCPTCGAAIEPGDKFCMACGTAIADAGAGQAAANVCPTCGTTAAPGDKFCMTCGAPLGAAGPDGGVAAAPVALICPNCGAEYAAGDKFCMVCGQKL